MEAIGVTWFRDASAAEWDALAQSPMQRHAWMHACAEHLACPADLRTVIIGGAGGPRAMAPLVKRGRRVPYFELLGARELGEPADLVYADEPSARALARALVQLGTAVMLPRVRATAVTVAAMKHAYRRAGIVRCRAASGAPYIELDDRWQGDEPPLDTGRRSDLRRARRRAEFLGPVRTDIACPIPAAFDAAFDEFVGVEGAGWKGRNGTALATDPVRQAFFRTYARAACRAGALRLCILRIGAQAAAAELAVESDGRLWLLKIGYDESFARCSPGQLLLADTVRYAARKGLQSCELLGAPEPWTHVWTDREHACVSISAYPARPMSLAVMAADAANAGRRKVAHLVASMI